MLIGVLGYLGDKSIQLGLRLTDSRLGLPNY
jgi:hypothetical protein